MKRRQAVATTGIGSSKLRWAWIGLGAILYIKYVTFVGKYFFLLHARCFWFVVAFVELYLIFFGLYHIALDTVCYVRTQRCKCLSAQLMEHNIVCRYLARKQFAVGKSGTASTAI